MNFKSMKTFFSGIFSVGEDGATSVSRRQALTGLGLVGAMALAAPMALAPTAAEAQSGRGRRGGRRYSRRDLRRRCRDWRFRRRNPHLCDRARGRGRPGTCVMIGPVQICD